MRNIVVYAGASTHDLYVFETHLVGDLLDRPGGMQQKSFRLEQDTILDMFFGDLSGQIFTVWLRCLGDI
ncbi:MAG TPA: hypothetical protein VJ953_13575 [Saprospiraceae bacterium]|nr:hypothetical protein [Saprospiraceae bacterium]